MAFARDDEDQEDDLFESVVRMADRMGLEGEKREVYIEDHMMQGGYTRVQTREAYAKVKPPEEEGGDDGGNRWGFGRRREAGNGGSSPRSGGNPRDDGDRF